MWLIQLKAIPSNNNLDQAGRAAHVLANSPTRTDSLTRQDHEITDSRLSRSARNGPYSAEPCRAEVVPRTFDYGAGTTCSTASHSGLSVLFQTVINMVAHDAFGRRTPTYTAAHEGQLPHRKNLTTPFLLARTRRALPGLDAALARCASVCRRSVCRRTVNCDR